MANIIIGIAIITSLLVFINLLKLIPLDKVKIFFNTINKSFKLFALNRIQPKFIKIKDGRTFFFNNN